MPEKPSPGQPLACNRVLVREACNPADLDGSRDLGFCDRRRGVSQTKGSGAGINQSLRLSAHCGYSKDLPYVRSSYSGRGPAGRIPQMNYLAIRDDKRPPEFVPFVKSWTEHDHLVLKDSLFRTAERSA